MPFLALIPALLGGWLKTALGFLASLPWQAYAALAALIAALLLWHAHTVAEHKAAAANFNAGYNADFKRADARERVFRASIAELTAALDDQSAAVAKLATESDARTQAAAKALQAAQSAARASENTARALDASASVARSKDGPCVPSETFLKNSGSL